MNKEKLCITIEHLSNMQNKSNPRITEETLDSIKEIVNKVHELFPSPIQNLPNEEEIDNAANDYF